VEDLVRLSGLMCKLFIPTKKAGGLHLAPCILLATKRKITQCTNFIIETFKTFIELWKRENAMLHPLSISRCRCPSFLNNLLKGIRDCSNHESFMKEKHEILKAAKKGGDAHKEISYRNIAD
jgi:hypothetical protein